MQIQTLSGTWQFRQTGQTEWLNATVPGGVHTDLLALGKIPDPFVGDNEKRVQWVAESDWEYQRVFQITGGILEEEKVFLVCDGIDTLANVMLNGKLIGRAEDMFIQYRWDIKSLLVAGENTLEVSFESPIQYASSHQAERELLGAKEAIPGGPYLRKAPCHFGWDWGPQLSPIGIWKDIRLEGYSNAKIEDVHLRQIHAKDSVTIEAKISLESWQPEHYTARMTVTSPTGEIYNSECEVKDDRTLLEVEISHPELWWPNGYGSHPLYQVDIHLLNGVKTFDARHYKLGLRTVELRQEPDEWGKSFTFFINDVPIFVKGSDWIPADTFPTRITETRLESLLQSVVQSNQNMLRIWGGGIYEDERFYDLCDTYGILVWQEFIFACSMYPFDDTAFLENVRVEANQNIRRLRHRTCLALWCGNNEIEWGMTDTWPKFRDDHQYDYFYQLYDQFFHKTLPTWVQELDPDRTYWPSSPSSNTPFKDVNGQKQGNAHYWDVWHGRKPFTAYRQQYPRFMSEFGFQSLPPFETIKTYAKPEDWNMTSYIMEWHQKNGSGNGLIISQMTDTFRMPGDFRSLVYLSMVLQAEGMRYGVEHWRRNKHRVSGTLYWQLNDCWPVASWASLDYFGNWKALHYAARKFYAPILLSICEEGLDVEVHVTSDLMQAWSGTIRWQLTTLNGNVVEQGESDVELKPLASGCFIRKSFTLNDDQKRDHVFVATLLHDHEVVSSTLSTFVPNKHLNLENPKLKTGVNIDGIQVVIQISALSLARFVELTCESSGIIFSDNYFDILAGKTARITCTLPEGWTVGQFTDKLEVRSLFNSFSN